MQAVRPLVELQTLTIKTGGYNKNLKPNKLKAEKHIMYYERILIVVKAMYYDGKRNSAFRLKRWLEKYNAYQYMDFYEGNWRVFVNNFPISFAVRKGDYLVQGKCNKFSIMEEKEFKSNFRRWTAPNWAQIKYKEEHK